jgi:hypothetical protein
MILSEIRFYIGTAFPNIGRMEVQYNDVMAERDYVDELKHRNFFTLC